MCNGVLMLAHDSRAQNINCNFLSTVLRDSGLLCILNNCPCETALCVFSLFCDGQKAGFDTPSQQKGFLGLCQAGLVSQGRCRCCCRCHGCGVVVVGGGVVVVGNLKKGSVLAPTAFGFCVALNTSGFLCARFCAAARRWYVLDVRKRSYFAQHFVPRLVVAFVCIQSWFGHFSWAVRGGQ